MAGLCRDSSCHCMNHSMQLRPPQPCLARLPQHGANPQLRYPLVSSHPRHCPRCPPLHQASASSLATISSEHDVNRVALCESCRTTQRYSASSHGTGHDAVPLCGSALLDFTSEVRRGRCVEAIPIHMNWTCSCNPSRNPHRT